MRIYYIAYIRYHRGDWQQTADCAVVLTVAVVLSSKGSSWR
jgi:hypothetical protein